MVRNTRPISLIFGLAVINNVVSAPRMSVNN